MGFLVGCQRLPLAANEFEGLPTHWKVAAPPYAINANSTLWIALEHYLGKSKSSKNLESILTLKAAGNSLFLRDASGFVHTDSEIQLRWKKVRLATPISWERQVLGPYASFESANRVALLLRKNGLQALVARPKEWQVWLKPGLRIPSGLDARKEKGIIEEAILPVLVSSNKEKLLLGPLEIQAQDGMLWKGARYKGPFRIQRDAYGTWTLVETVQMEDYLEGVVPHEIGASAPFSALAVQAVLARTWALANSNRFLVDGFHLCSNTQCQVYSDPAKATSPVREAIASTKGKVLIWQGKPINAFYHATNGGVIAAAEEAWATQPMPYLKAKFDGSKSWARNFSLPLHKERDIKNFLKLGDGSFGANHHRFRWNRELKAVELGKSLAKLLSTYSTPTEIRVVERGRSGRVLSLKIVFDSKRKPLILRLDNIRRYLPQLPSTLFVIEKVGQGIWNFSGGGFGHGVGLSQAGAMDLARRDWPIEKIFLHYYPGATYGFLPVSHDPL